MDITIITPSVLALSHRGISSSKVAIKGRFYNSLTRIDSFTDE